MKQNQINLKQVMQKNEIIGEGADNGKILFAHLVSYIDSHSQFNIFYLSVGDTVFNASFAREGIVKVAKHYRMKKGLCLIDIEDEDSLDNILGPVTKLEQPVSYNHNGDFHLVSYKKVGAPSKTNQPIFTYILARGLTTATEVADEFKLKLSNASTKLKALFEEGFVLREEKKSTSGGIEYFYFPIK